MLDTNKAMYRHVSFIIGTKNGSPYGVGLDAPEELAEVEAYLSAHPEALVPEPVPEPPTAEQVAATARAAILAQLDDLDRRSIRPLRAREMTKVVELETQASALRDRLAALA